MFRHALQNPFCGIEVRYHTCHLLGILLRCVFSLYVVNAVRPANKALYMGRQIRLGLSIVLNLSPKYGPGNKAWLIYISQALYIYIYIWSYRLGWVEISTWRRWAGLAYKSAIDDPPPISTAIGLYDRHLITSQFY